MNPSIKKLSSAFLLAAVLTSSFAWGISSLVNRPQGGKTPGDANGAAAAFNKQENQVAFQRLTGGGPDGQNLTDMVTELVAEQLVSANPQGPQSANGLVQVLSPKGEDIASYFQSNPPSESALAVLDESKVKTLQDFTAGDVTRYLDSVSQLESDLGSDPVWQAWVGAASSSVIDTGLVGQAEKALSAARDAAYAVKVPAPLAPLHKSLLAVLTTNASFAQIALQDPIAAVALSKKLNTMLAQQSADMDQVVKDLQANPPDLVSGLAPERQSMLAALLGVQVAHATFPTIDYVHIGTTIANWLKEFAHWAAAHWQGVLLGQLKTIILQKLSQKVIEWAQGHGVPGYVTNWLVYEADAALSTKFGFVSKKTAKACGNAATEGVYGTILSSALGVYSSAANFNGGTIGDDINCPPVGGSATYWAEGGIDWGTYLDATKNNVWNDLLTVRDQAIQEAASASEAAVHAALSGRGSLDVWKCGDGTVVDNEHKCGDGSDAYIVTQGSTKQDLVSKAVDNAFDLISAANNPDLYEAIANVIVSAAIHYVIDEGSGLFDSSSHAGGPTPPTAANTFDGQLAQYRNILERAWSDESQAINNLNGIIAELRDVLPSICTDPQDGPTVTEALALADEFEASKPPLEDKQQEIQELIFKLDQVHNLEELQAQLGSLTAVSNLATQASGDKQTSENGLFQANQLLSTCN